MGPSEYGSFVVIYAIINLIQGRKKKIRLKFLEEKVNDIYFKKKRKKKKKEGFNEKTLLEIYLR